MVDSGNEFLARLDATEAEGWARIHSGRFWTHLRTRGLDRELYVAVMTEIYHYTRFNAQNQALVAVRLDSSRLQLMRYCFHHAFEEAGHDLMALHDLGAIGEDKQATERTNPLPETQAFIAYLWGLAERDATARLGYSYWAEGAYNYAKELTDAMRDDMKLEDSQMTFFVAHSRIDKEHKNEVVEILKATCQEPALQHGVADVLRTSLRLTGNILDAAYDECIRRRTETSELRAAVGAE